MIDFEVRFDTADEMNAFMKRVMPANIYDDVEELQQKVAALEAMTTDTGWLDLPLAEGVEKWSDTNYPQYRKIGKIVFIRGAVKGIVKRNTLIGTLPEGFRPVVAAPYTQNTSMKTGYFAMFSRMIVNAKGEVWLEAITEGGTYEADKWFPVGTVFAVD